MALIIGGWLIRVGHGDRGKPRARHRRPRTEADISDERLDQAVRELIERKLITQRMLEGGVFSVNVRHISGAETTLQHGRHH